MSESTVRRPDRSTGPRLCHRHDRVLSVLVALRRGRGCGWRGALGAAVGRPPTGLAYQGRWYLEPAGPDFSFAGIALFVLIAFPLGLVLGRAGRASVTRRRDRHAWSRCSVGGDARRGW